MAQNKKPRKKYIPKYNHQNIEVVENMGVVFKVLYKFFQDLKNGKTKIYRFDDVGYAPSIYFSNQEFAAYIFIQIFCEYAQNVLLLRNITLDYSPLYDFANILCERNERLYFEVSEINKAYAFVQKIHNIFSKEINIGTVRKGIDALELNYKGLKYTMKGI